jgi:hypothetical protein
VRRRFGGSRDKALESRFPKPAGHLGAAVAVLVLGAQSVVKDEDEGAVEAAP